ncbi:CBU_0592 family membrane protein [Lutibacter sp.]
MNTIDWLGFVGVFLILLAYILNVTNKVTSKSLLFISLNLVGASIACLASILLNYIPFVILEGIWALISFFSFITYFQQHK